MGAENQYRARPAEQRTQLRGNWRCGHSGQNYTVWGREPQDPEEQRPGKSPESSLNCQRKVGTMSLQPNEIINTVARELLMPEEELVKQGLRSVLERKLREIKAEIFAITGRYRVS